MTLTRLYHRDIGIPGLAGVLLALAQLAEVAAALGHDLSIWKARGDVYGRQDARCRLCGAMATVCVEPPTVYGLGLAYGKALTDQCRESGEAK